MRTVALARRNVTKFNDESLTIAAQAGRTQRNVPPAFEHLQARVRRMNDRSPPLARQKMAQE